MGYVITLVSAPYYLRNRKQLSEPYQICLPLHSGYTAEMLVGGYEIYMDASECGACLTHDSGSINSS